MLSQNLQIALNMVFYRVYFISLGNLRMVTECYIHLRNSVPVSTGHWRSPFIIWEGSNIEGMDPP